MNQPAKFPCKFDNNGECIVCDCWPSDCPFKKKDGCVSADKVSEANAKIDELKNTVRNLFGIDVDKAAQQLARLKDFENVAEALWPFVRSFGLCGAHPAAIAAVVALGKLLGHTEASQSTVFEIGDKVRSETINEVADKVEELLRGKVLTRDIVSIVDEVRNL